MDDKEYETIGKHIAIDCWGVIPQLLNDLDFLKMSAEIAIEKSGANIIDVQEKKFEPQGATVLYLLSESHFSIHTYPEKGFCAIDIYTCGSHVKPELAIATMIIALAPKKVYHKSLTRGMGEISIE